MLGREAILKQIAADRVEPIQELVAVDYDNGRQMPVRFRHRGGQYQVEELIGSFRGPPGCPSILYVVRTAEGAFGLLLDLQAVRESRHLHRGRWVLHYRVEERA